MLSQLSCKLSQLSCSDERRQFTELLSSGDVTSVLPDWSPWWSVRKKVKKIREIDEPDDTSHEDRCPRVAANIPEFTLKSSPVLKYGLLNIVYGYAYAVKYLHGEQSDSPLELVNIVQLLSGKLSLSCHTSCHSCHYQEISGVRTSRVLTLPWRRPRARSVIIRPWRYPSSSPERSRRMSWTSSEAPLAPTASTPSLPCQT